MDIKIIKNENPKEKPPVDNLGFGQYFTDHMFVMDYKKDIGWHNARIEPFGDLVMHPAATVLHYGAEVFEGLKAYKLEDGRVQLFRPSDNMKRLNNSAERLCLPQIPFEDLMESLLKFVDHERDWVPDKKGTSLYIRPFMYGHDPYLGVHTVENCSYIIIASPSGSYYSDSDLSPVKIMIEEEDVRAVRGGTGYAKCGGNYAASVRACDRAEDKGYSQVLWLDGVERKYIEEVGAMNVLFKIDGIIVTPELNGSILDGITRRSCIRVLKDMGYEVQERKISVDELVDAMENNKLEEAWGTGTAAIVSPISVLAYKGREYQIKDGGVGELTNKLYEKLTGIQWGLIPDEYGWTVQI
ncbi:MAG: branched-chain amino acid aminotransferase [Tissierellia bacterium]|nr:branched-chain amino acid aminotransferase [Tissierellia bacterium]